MQVVRPEQSFLKKIGTDNEHTNDYLATSKKFSKELQTKLFIRITVALAGLAMYYFGNK